MSGFLYVGARINAIEVAEMMTRGATPRSRGATHRPRRDASTRARRRSAARPRQTDDGGVHANLRARTPRVGVAAIRRKSGTHHCGVVARRGIDNRLIDGCGPARSTRPSVGDDHETRGMKDRRGVANRSCVALIVGTSRRAGAIGRARDFDQRPIAHAGRTERGRHRRQAGASRARRPGAGSRPIPPADWRGRVIGDFALRSDRSAGPEQPEMVHRIRVIVRAGGPRLVGGEHARGQEGQDHSDQAMPHEACKPGPRHAVRLDPTPRGDGSRVPKGRSRDEQRDQISEYTLPRDDEQDDGPNGAHNQKLLS